MESAHISISTCSLGLGADPNLSRPASLAPTEVSAMGRKQTLASSPKQTLAPRLAQAVSEKRHSQFECSRLRITSPQRFIAGEPSGWRKISRPGDAARAAVLIAIVNAIKERMSNRTVERIGDQLGESAPRGAPQPVKVVNDPTEAVPVQEER